MKVIAFALFFLGFQAFGATTAHYRFEAARIDRPIFELFDSSGNGHHGRVLGQEPMELTTDVPPYPGVGNTALDLRGRYDHAVIPHHSDFAPEGDWTIEFFIKAARFHQEHGGVTNVIGGTVWSAINTNLAYTIMAKHNTNEPTLYGSAWAFHYLPANGWVVFTISYGIGQGELMLLPADLRDGEWHHIAVVFASGREHEIAIFYDGFQTQSHNIGDVDFSWGTGPIYLGAWARQDTTVYVQDRNFDGFLDEVRFSNTALNAESFVTNLEPFLYPTIPVEVYPAFEIQFHAERGTIYRIERSTFEGTWATLGYLQGEGAVQSFFHRMDATHTGNYRVVRDNIEIPLPLDFDLLNAVEVRFPTKAGQLYTITGCETVNCQNAQEIFVLGDGAKRSDFLRATGETRFFRVDRY